MQLHITTANEEVFKSKIFEMQVYEAIDATETVPEEYAEWIDIANSAISRITALEDKITKNEKERDNAEKSEKPLKMKGQSPKKETLQSKIE